MALTAKDIETVRDTIGHIQQANSSIQNDCFEAFRHMITNIINKNV